MGHPSPLSLLLLLLSSPSLRSSSPSGRLCCLSASSVVPFSPLVPGERGVIKEVSEGISKGRNKDCSLNLDTFYILLSYNGTI